MRGEEHNEALKTVQVVRVRGRNELAQSDPRYIFKIGVVELVIFYKTTELLDLLICLEI